MSRPWKQWSLLYAAVFAMTAVRAQEQPAADAEFLEYLANWDIEDEGWNDYLASTDVRKLAESKGKAAGTKDKTKDKAADTPGDKAQDEAKTTKVDEHADK